jgi:hypothetical protein
MSTAFKFICFSDIDGTLVHYLDSPQQLQEVVGNVIWLPTSTTGRQVGHCPPGLTDLHHSRDAKQLFEDLSVSIRVPNY